LPPRPFSYEDLVNSKITIIIEAENAMPITDHTTIKEIVDSAVDEFAKATT
jgi:hypothetical protein